MQIMLHVPLVVHQVLYAYNKKKAGSIPKSVLNCWVNILFWLLFFFFSFYLAFSSCGSLLYLLQEHCRQYWVPADCEDNIGRANNSCGPESPPSPWKLPQPLKADPVLPAGAWLMKEHFPQGVCTLCLLKAPAPPSFPSPASPGCRRDFYRGSQGWRQPVSGSPAEAAVHGFLIQSCPLCSFTWGLFISKLLWRAHTKGFVLAVSV